MSGSGPTCGCVHEDNDLTGVCLPGALRAPVCPHLRLPATGRAIGADIRSTCLLLQVFAAFAGLLDDAAGGLDHLAPECPVEDDPRVSVNVCLGGELDGQPGQIDGPPSLMKN